MAAAAVRTLVLGSVIALAAGATTPAANATPPEPPRAVQWVALGDSYTAGVIQAAGDLAEPTPDGCARTTDSYPEQIRRHLGPLVELRNASCGAATIANVHREQQEVVLGRPMPPDGLDPDGPFAPAPPQIQALSQDTDLVTVGAGGNTLGFAEILFRCVELGKRSWVWSSPCAAEFDADLDDRLAAVRADYDEMLDAIHAASPNAEVLTVGYPRVLPDSGWSCFFNNLLQFGSITPGDLTWARTQVLEPLNEVLRQVTAEHDDTFIDPYAVGTGHSVCDGTGTQNWVDGILSTVIPPTFALVHPNARGHAATAALIEDRILFHTNNTNNTNKARKND
ncbi:SGNH/GDSL hydrolase family protein [Actinosynnema pretiosum subsp. pretiosum]|uniref:SGNH/GDSL hydrolase family protein n=1 Tax=Actinosynnema pretiosum subsp. pretiosum TaxID=103721 RepID=A0AA45L8K0_9PSEU|nr:Lipolytic enzyme, G-D-S-L [Actinosynnema pretiosum subsp. pretiosum]QUF04750.1 SGNH/GDSL hydrolase family protein [Actinosynnema pretiosum subsp. pretiosum]